MTIIVQNNAMFVRPEVGLLVRIHSPVAPEERPGCIIGVDAQDGTCSVLTDGKYVTHGCKYVQVDESVENQPAVAYCYPSLIAGYPVIQRDFDDQQA